jgi:hypothetical protein
MSPPFSPPGTTDRRAAVAWINRLNVVYLESPTVEEEAWTAEGLAKHWTLVEDACPICDRSYPASETVTLANPQTGHTLDVCDDCAFDWPPEPVTRAMPEREV